MIQLKYLKQELAKIKENGRSFLGIDGGNINSKIWFCGIEFGGSMEEMEKYYKSTVDYYREKEFDVPFRENVGDYKGSIYDRYLSAMYINLFKSEVLKDGNDTKPIEKVLNDELYNQDSKIFKLNLYPLGKKNTDWDPLIEKNFNLSKKEYYEEFFDKRKQFFKELVKEFTPLPIRLYVHL